MTEKVFKFPLFYLANKEIQSGKIQTNIFFFNFLAPVSAEFPCSQDFLSFFTLFLYKLWDAPIESGIYRLGDLKNMMHP